MGIKNFHFPTPVYMQQFDALKPLDWTVNFADGTSGNKKQYKNFHLIPEEKRLNIRALRLISGDRNITISRKVNNQIIEGFFYHIKAGRKIAMGSQIGLDVGYFEERIGFCYNSNGDAKFVKLDHIAYAHPVRMKFERIREILAGLPNNHPELQNENINLDAFPQITRILNANIKYGVDIQEDTENINSQDQFADGTPTIKDPKSMRNSVAVNIARFGRLEDLPELGTPPRITTNIEETVIGKDRT
ncbi:hypothetical protein LCGC14_0267220 [marine sediment metagenome]|uniref:Uncharacterized protein n=1 Tax=marine sediment metagenome TaxID=412755 RepID=A0A0F9WKK5_9ZZZZ